MGGTVHQNLMCPKAIPGHHPRTTGGKWERAAIPVLLLGKERQPKEARSPLLIQNLCTASRGLKGRGHQERFLYGVKWEWQHHQQQAQGELGEPKRAATHGKGLAATSHQPTFPLRALLPPRMEDQQHHSSYSCSLHRNKASRAFPPP